MIKASMFYIPVWLFLTLISCGSNPSNKVKGEPITHELFNSLLSKYVSKNGKVNYQGFQKDSIIFLEYLNLLSNNPPSLEGWNKQERLAYWLNAYNAFTIQLVLKNYPLKSIKDIGSAIQIPFINTPWDIKFIKIGDEKLDLNNIEHSILRKVFNEPRIHFAIVCASLSCPNLRNEAYTADKLEEQLAEQARKFINDSSKNILEKEQVKISKIFSWFKGDFTKNSTLIDFMNKFSKENISPKAKVSYMDYDWSLNE
jgi:hypothetical protein